MKIIDELYMYRDDTYQAKLLKYFKTGIGEYGYGDQFYGLRMNQVREVAKKYKDIDLNTIELLLSNKIHEVRNCALLIMVYQYQHTKDEKIVKLYLDNTKYINNWDLVDCSAPNIIGNYVLENDDELLYKLAKSNNMWERRIAIVATLTLIKHNKLDVTYKLCDILMRDDEDLIHKACGWMLREAGKVDKEGLFKYLDKHKKKMPRVMLRYAIEKFDKEEREYLMRK